MADFDFDVPDELSENFSWYVEAGDEVDADEERMFYGLIQLGANATYDDNKVTPGIAGGVIPIQLGRMTLDEVSMESAEDIIGLAQEMGFQNVEDVVSVVAKKDDDFIKDHRDQNPLLQAQLAGRKRQKKAREESRKRNKGLKEDF